MKTVQPLAYLASAAALAVVGVAPLALAQTNPVEHDNAVVTACHQNVDAKIRRAYAGVQRVQWITDTTTESFISNAQVGIDGEGQFLQSDGFHGFSYSCQMNTRSGAVESSSFSLQ